MVPKLYSVVSNVIFATWLVSSGLSAEIGLRMRSALAPPRSSCTLFSGSLLQANRPRRSTIGSSLFINAWCLCLNSRVLELDS